MQITNTAQTVIHNNTRQGAKVVGVSNSNAQTSTGKGFISTPAAVFKNSTKDDYDTSTLNPLQKRVLSLQEQITNINSDEKMEKDTKNNLLKPLQEELGSVQEQILKQQEEAPVTDINQKTDNKEEATVTVENNNKSVAQQLLSWRDMFTKGSALTLTEKVSGTTICVGGQEFQDMLIAQWRKEGKTNAEIYQSTHLQESMGMEFFDHFYEIRDIVKNVCDNYGFDYYEQRNGAPDMEAILKKGGGKAAYKAMSQAFSDFDRTLRQQRSLKSQEYSTGEYSFISQLQKDSGINIVSAENNTQALSYSYSGNTCNISGTFLELMAQNPQHHDIWKNLVQGQYENLTELAKAIASTGDTKTAEAITGKEPTMEDAESVRRKLIEKNCEDQLRASNGKTYKFGEDLLSAGEKMYAAAVAAVTPEEVEKVQKSEYEDAVAARNSRLNTDFTHDNAENGTIWEVVIPPSADPKKSRDPLSFIK